MKHNLKSLLQVCTLGIVAVIGTSVAVSNLMPDAQAKIRKKDKPAEPAPSEPDGGRTPQETADANKDRTVKICNPACTNGMYCDSHTGTCKN